MNKLLSVTGILISLTFTFSFLVLFILNPQTYEELNNLSLTAYNILGMRFRLWAAGAVYGATGLLNIVFCVGLLLHRPTTAYLLFGRIITLIAGLVWLSFAIFPYDPMTDIGNHLLLIRVITCL